MKEIQTKEKRLVKNTIIYTISNFGSKILSFLIVPLYTHYLTTAEFGTYDTIVSILNLLVPMCILAIHEGLLRWLLKAEESQTEIVCTGMSLYGILIIVTDIILIIILQIFEWKFDWMFIVLLTVNSLYTVMQFVARGERKNRAFAISGVLYTIVMLGLNICFVVLLKYGITGMLMSMILAYICNIIYLFFSLRKELVIRKYAFNKTLAKKMMGYSVMLVPNNISWWIMNASDRILMTTMIGSHATGIYSLACKFPTIVTIVHMLFYQAWQEQAVLEYDSDDRDEFYTKVFNIYMKLVCCMVLLLIPFSKFVITYFMDSSYLSAYKYLGVLYIASLFSSFSGFYGTGYISAKDTKNAMKTTMVGAVINILINILFISQIGIWAACISTLIGYIIVWCIRRVQTKKYFSIRVDWAVFTFLIIMNILFSIGVCYANTVHMSIMFLAAIGITLILNKNLLLDIFNAFIKKIKKKN